MLISFEKRKFDFLILFGFSLLVIIFKFNILNQPYHWDATSIEVPASIWMMENGFNLFLGGISNGHPPFFYFVLAIFFKILGVTPLVSRIPILLSVILSLFYTYKIGKYVYNETVGIFASLTLFFLPIFFAQSGLVLSTSFEISLSIMALYYVLTRKLIVFSIISTLLILTRETTILLVIVLILFWLYYIFKQKKLCSFYQSLFLFLPVLVFIIWLIGNKLKFGWFYLPNPIVTFELSILTFSRNLSRRLLDLFVIQYRFLLFIILLISAYFSKQKTKRETHFQNITIIIIFTYLVFYSILSSGFLPRYFLFLYPLFILITLGNINKFFSVKSALLLNITLFIILSMLFMSTWQGHRNIPPGWQLETNMEYLDVVKTHKQATVYIEDRYYNETILTCWPMTVELYYPYLEYVNKEIKVRDYNQNRSTEGINVIYYSVQSNCYNLLREININNFNLEKEFKSNGKITRIYVHK